MSWYLANERNILGQFASACGIGDLRRASEQAMYLAFYLGALANIPEIREIFADSGILSPAILTTVLVVTAVALIPVRLFLFTAVVFDFQQLAEIGRASCRERG